MGTEADLLYGVREQVDKLGELSKASGLSWR